MAHLLPIFFLLTSIPLSFSSSLPTVYDILPKFGLPKGLLPNNVKNYTLSPEGSFSVELKCTCYLQFDYLVYYEKKITGILKYGSITGLKGIQVKRLGFLWFDVDEIRVDLPPSDYIYFQDGIINKKLAVGQFQTVKDCQHKKKLQLQLQLPATVDDTAMLLTE